MGSLFSGNLKTGSGFVLALSSYQYLKKTLMERFLRKNLLFFYFYALFSAGTVTADEYYSRDPEVIYNEEYPELNLIVEIPGYKLDSQSVYLHLIGKQERECAQNIDSRVLDVATGYVIYGGLSFRDEFSLYAAKELGGYILLYFDEPALVGGGFQLVYAKRSKNIVGIFSLPDRS